MTTALDIITRACRLLGVVRKTESLGADEAADGLVALNGMIASWSNTTLSIHGLTWESFSLSAASVYTIGSGQTINTVLPMKISAAAINIGSVDYPLTVLTDQQYQQDISFKSIASNIPDYITYDNGYLIGKIRFYPQLGTAATLKLQSEKVITAFASLAATVDLPPGTDDALVFNLALRLAPEYEIEPSKLVYKGAMESLAMIRLNAARARPMKYSPDPIRTGDIYSGYW